MIISAISDLDVLGLDLEPFWDILKKARKPDLLLFAGDMYDFGNPEAYGLILDFIKMIKWDCPIVAVFGNHEFDEDIDDIRKASRNKIKFLVDESTELKIKGKSVGIVGSRGSIDVPTWWQFHHVSGIGDTYKERTEKIKEMLALLKTDIKILLTHYSPTYKTLKGESQNIYPYLGSNKLEKVLIKTRPDFAVHGHAHNGIPLAFVEGVPVFNVCFTANKKLVEIDMDNMPKTGLKKFA
ncbi:MAG: metallophosphoesterase [Candidatus Aenigmatarchaeota archaeon]